MDYSLHIIIRVSHGQRFKAVSLLAERTNESTDLVCEIRNKQTATFDRHDQSEKHSSSSRHFGKGTNQPTDGQQSSDIENAITARKSSNIF